MQSDKFSWNILKRNSIDLQSSKFLYGEEKDEWSDLRIVFLFQFSVSSGLSLTKVAPKKFYPYRKYKLFLKRDINNFKWMVELITNESSIFNSGMLPNYIYEKKYLWWKMF